MSSKSMALEWLTLATKNIETAELLLSVNHYTDVIAIEIHQTIEKAIKALFAYNNEQIPRIHYLPKLIDYASKHIKISNIEEDDIFVINDYYLNTRYPGPKYFLPSRDEVAQNMTIARQILNDIRSFIEQN